MEDLVVPLGKLRAWSIWGADHVDTLNLVQRDVAADLELSRLEASLSVDEVQSFLGFFQRLAVTG